MPLQLLRTMQMVSALFTMPHASPPFAEASISHRGGDAKPLHPTPFPKSQALLSFSHEAPTPKGIAHILFVALQYRPPRQGAASPQGAFNAPGATHLCAAQTRPRLQPSSTVHDPPAADRGAQAPQSLLDFSQCVLTHCQLDPQP